MTDFNNLQIGDSFLMNIAGEFKTVKVIKTWTMQKNPHCKLDCGLVIPLKLKKYYEDFHHDNIREVHCIRRGRILFMNDRGLNQWLEYSKRDRQVEIARFKEELIDKIREY